MPQAAKAINGSQALSKKERLRLAITRKPSSIRAEKCRRSFYTFVQEFWDQVALDEPLWNWHIPYLCEELQKMASRVAEFKPRLYDTIINIPPGTTKSITCSIMFPAWCWTNWYWMRFIASSYSGALSLEHAEYSRDLIRSDKFQEYFPELQIKRDKDTKSNFRLQKKVFNKKGEVIDIKQGGNRYSTSVGGTLTGYHAHILIVDDPLDPNRSVSDTELKTANRWIDQTLSTRKVDKAVTPTILIMQRLHQNDPTGHILDKNKKNVHHICLPGTLDGYEDHVKPPDLKEYYVDGLLDPARMGADVLQDMRLDLGAYGFAGQVGQDPAPPGGGMFKTENFVPFKNGVPEVMIKRTIRYWDKAGTEAGGAMTGGIKMAEMLDIFNGPRFVVLHAKFGQWSSGRRERQIKQTAEEDGRGTVVFVEQEPGSGGKESAEGTVKNLAGFVVHADPVSGSKVARAQQYAAQVEVGNVGYIVDPTWNYEFFEHHRHFPVGRHLKDLVDAASGAFNKLNLNARKKRAGALKAK